MEILDLSDAICDDDRVSVLDACPYCSEDRIDKLVWESDGECVECQTCGTIYVPGEDER